MIMSNSTIVRREFQPLTDSTVLPDNEGMRVIEVRYRYTEAQKKAGKEKRDNAYVEVSAEPTSEQTVLDNIQLLAPLFSLYLEGVQNEMVCDKHSKAETAVFESTIDLNAIVTYLTAKAESERLSKDKVTAWFDASIADYLIPLAVTALGFSGDIDTLDAEQASKVVTVIEGYKALYVSMAAPSVTVSEKDGEKLIKHIKGANQEGSKIGMAIVAKIQKLFAKPTVTVIDL
jgi:hypothetical protein